MHALNWNDLRYFLEVQRLGSVTKAGASLGVSYTTVSRRISVLEQAVGVPMFDRSESGWALTAAGGKILSDAQAMAEAANEIQRNAMSETHEIEGRLRITSLNLLLETLLMPEIKRFQDAHPNIELELISTLDPLSLAAREADFAFRATDNPPPTLIGTRIASMRFEIYGSKSVYEDRLAGRPVSVITRVGDGHSLPSWITKYFENHPNVLRNNSIEVAAAAAKLGFGAARLPCFSADCDPDLYRLPEAQADREIDIWLLSHADLRRTPRMRLFRDFIQDRLTPKVDLLEGRVPFKR